MEREGGLEETHRNTQNAALNVDLFEISFVLSLCEHNGVYRIVRKCIIILEFLLFFLHERILKSFI